MGEFGRMLVNIEEFIKRGLLPIKKAERLNHDSIEAKSKIKEFKGEDFIIKYPSTWNFGSFYISGDEDICGARHIIGKETEVGPVTIYLLYGDVEEEFTLEKHINNSKKKTNIYNNKTKKYKILQMGITNLSGKRFFMLEAEENNERNIQYMTINDGRAHQLSIYVPINASEEIFKEIDEIINGFEFIN